MENSRNEYIKNQVETTSQEVNNPSTLTEKEIITHELVEVANSILKQTDKWRSESYHFVHMDLYSELIKLKALTRQFSNSHV